MKSSLDARERLKDIKLVLQIASAFVMTLLGISQLLPKLDPLLADLAARIYDLVLVASLAVLSALLWFALVLYRENVTLKASLSAREKIEARERRPGKKRIADESESSRGEKKTVLPARNIELGAYDDRHYKLRVEKGKRLHALVKSTNPADFLIINRWHYVRGDLENPEDDEYNATHGELLVECQKDEYYLIVLNARPRKALVQVEAWTD